MAHTISERRRRERLRENDPKGWRQQLARPRRERLHAKRIMDLWNKRAQAAAGVVFPDYRNRPRRQDANAGRTVFGLSDDRQPWICASMMFILARRSQA
jgi:hypothetical protein